MADGFDIPQPVRLGQLPEVTTAALRKVPAETGSSHFKESSQQTSAQTKGNTHKDVSLDTAAVGFTSFPAIIQLMKHGDISSGSFLCCLRCPTLPCFE